MLGITLGKTLIDVIVIGNEKTTIGAGRKIITKIRVIIRMLTVMDHKIVVQLWVVLLLGILIPELEIATIAIWWHLEETTIHNILLALDVVEMVHIYANNQQQI